MTDCNFCTSCGGDLDGLGGADYCPHCGNAIGNIKTTKFSRDYGGEVSIDESSTQQTFKDPAEILRNDQETLELFRRIAHSEAQCAPDFKRALKNAGCWNGGD